MSFAAFTHALVDDVQSVFASAPFQAAATAAGAQVEENRLALVGALRAMPSVVRLAKPAMQQQATPEPFLCVAIRSQEREGFEIEAHPGIDRDEHCHATTRLLAARAHLYARFTRAQLCAAVLYTDGSEAISLSWGGDLPEHAARAVATTWSRTPGTQGLAHDPVAFLVGTGMLYARWKERAPDLPLFETVREDGTQQSHPGLPQPAAALAAVGHWPVRFAHTPADLDAALSALICEPFGADN